MFDTVRKDVNELAQTAKDKVLLFVLSFSEQIVILPLWTCSLLKFMIMLEKIFMSSLKLSLKK